jgi:hypothetical protein
MAYRRIDCGSNDLVDSFDLPEECIDLAVVLASARAAE